MKPLLTITCIFLTIQSATCQMKQDIAAYIEKYKAIALEEMVRCKIPASITIAQGLHESSYGRSKLSTEANNHFGIKCKDEWDGKKFYQNDDAPNECFRVYDHAEDSYADHSDFLVTRSRYAGLFELPITDYKAWAHGLKSSGYATNPRYAEILIKTIEDYNLTQFDQEGLAQIDNKEKLISMGTPTGAPVIAQVKTTTPAPIQSNTVQQTPTAASTIPSPQAPVLTETPREIKRTNTSKPVNNIFATTNNDAAKKEIIINGTKAVKAQGTIDPLAIAYNYQIQYAQILAFNDMNEGDKFKEGENIFLQSKRARGGEEKYVAQPGESMHDISQRFGIKLKDLYQKNLMAQNDQPVPGETLNLQEKRTAAPRTMAYSDFLKSLNTGSITQNNSTTTANAGTDNSVPNMIKNNYMEQAAEYKVAPSDTLYSIAKKFNTTVQQLRSLNNLESTDLHPGQTLIVAK